LKERGLELSHEKTQITHVEEGFDFLGQNVRRYGCGKVLTKPSSQNVKTFLSKIRETIDNSGSLTAGKLIQRLNQQIKGWTMYHRYAASQRTFSYVDHRIFQMGLDPRVMSAAAIPRSSHDDSATSDSLHYGSWRAIPRLFGSFWVPRPAHTTK